MIKLFFTLLLIFSSTQAMAALSYTHLDSGNGNAVANTFTTNSITVAANELVIIVFTGWNTGGAEQISSVVYNGTSTTLTSIESQQYRHGTMGSHLGAVSAYYFIPAGSSSGTITATSLEIFSEYSWSTFYFTGENTTTPIVTGQETTNECSAATTCTTLTESLGSPIASNDATVAAFTDSTANPGGTAITATAGYTTIDNISTNVYQLAEYEITGTQAPSATWATANAEGLAFEVAVAPSISKFLGVADASISKISGVADASISKIAGVSGP